LRVTRQLWWKFLALGAPGPIDDEPDLAVRYALALQGAEDQLDEIRRALDAQPRLCRAAVAIVTSQGHTIASL
jgi:hypothetical protein